MAIRDFVELDVVAAWLVIMPASIVLPPIAAAVCVALAPQLVSSAMWDSRRIMQSGSRSQRRRWVIRLAITELILVGSAVAGYVALQK
jgi:hypothetical protein